MSRPYTKRLPVSLIKHPSAIAKQTSNSFTSKLQPRNPRHPTHSLVRPSAAMFSSRAYGMVSERVVSLREIPTVSDMHISGDLTPSSSEPAYPPSDDINKRVGFYRGDITSIDVDAIVNAANSSLMGGGGVDGAIHRAAGPGLVKECCTLGGCRTGQAKITGGYELIAKHVIHTVGPVYNRRSPPESEDLLRSCYEESLRVAVKNGLKTVAFSAISTGVYGYPSRDAARAACDTVRRFLEHEEGKSLMRVVFVVFDEPVYAAYKAALPKYFPPADGT